MPLLVGDGVKASHAEVRHDLIATNKSHGAGIMSDETNGPTYQQRRKDKK